MPSEPTPVPFWSLIRAREHAGLTQAQAAIAASPPMTRSQWCDLEAGRYRSPGLAVLRRAAAAVGVPLADLL